MSCSKQTNRRRFCNDTPMLSLKCSTLLLVLFLVACGPSTTPEVPSVTSQPATTKPVRQVADALSMGDASARKSRVSNIHYTLFFDIASSPQYFSGQSRLQFDLVAADSALTIDLSGAEIDRIVANGIEVEDDYNGFFITIPQAALLAGPNEIEIDYRHNYDKDGTGLHRFTDPEDGLTYLYTYLWPYYANRLFPAFDQPNLKATFDLQVRAPEDWTVVSTSVGEVSETSDSVSTWRFATTPKMSTYIFSLHAGPYHIWEEMAGDIPIRLFARQSLAGYVTVDEWFDITRGGLEFYARYFEISYPFGKYDQLIVPDFNIGAMENIAAVTFSEGYVQRKASDRFERESRASVILHEMAHMWFGDLVTKNWWSELWLNESFATLMANIALVDSTEFKDAWHRFFTNDKQIAYHKDSRVTTHPIQVPVNSTADFFSVFDAITYRKGSSVLKQLAHYTGYENYRKGVSNYLKEHAYGNTTLQDFIDAQAASSGLDLDRWSKQWLYQAGFNELSATFKCLDGRITALTIQQSATEENPQLRQHRIDVALYLLKNDRLSLGQTFDVQIDGAITAVSEALGSPCPALVFPNHDDWGYARVVLDEASMGVIKGKIQQLDDPLARSMMIRSLYDMSSTDRMPIRDYLVLAINESQTEANIRVLAQLIQSISSSVDLLYRLRPESDAALTEVLSLLANHSWNQATSETDPDRARLWFDLLLKASDGPVAEDRLRSLLSETVTLPGVQLSEDLRWSIIISLSTIGVPDSERLINSERERDSSDQGQKFAIAADAARPQAAIKEHWLKELTDPLSELGLARQRYAMASLFPATQTRQQGEQLTRILQSLPGLSERDPYFLSSFVTGLLQPVCTAESVAAMAQALDADGLNSTSRLFLREAHQADAECLKLRNGLAQNSNSE